MTAPRGGLLVLGAMAAVAALSARVDAQAPPAMFSARVESVRVDVDVRRRGEPVAGLTAADFEIRDNGVPQRVELMSPAALPLSVVLALDASASLDEQERRHLIAAGGRVIDALRDGDEAALLTFADHVTVLTALTGDRARLRALIDRPVTGRDTALYDAAHAAMVIGTAARGRPIVILLSDGDDTASVVTGQTLIDSARRTGAVVCIVALGEPGMVLPRLAETTGGVLVKETSLDQVAARFAEILDGFRRRYLLSFTPAGVPRAGWHTLAVKVKGGGDVRARSGYWAVPAEPPR